MTSIRYSIVVPVFAGVATIERLCQRISKCLELRGHAFEIILVDDASRDGSWPVIEALAARQANIHGVRLSRNFGQHNATACGFRYARGQYVITIDEDLQFPPEAIAALIDCQERLSADVVYGVPKRRNSPLWRRIASRIAMSIPRHVMRVDFSITSFRLMRAKIAAEVAASVRHDIIIDAHLGWLTDRIVAIEVEHQPDVRASSYGPLRLIGFFLCMLCNYTTFPLRATTLVGGLMAAGSLLAAVLFIAIHFLVRSGVPGYSSLIVSIFFSTGVVLMGIGVMSEYLARIFMQINHRPQAYVRETAGFTEETENRRAA